MRELTATEIGQVGGGSNLSDFAADGGAIGLIFGAVVDGTVTGAARGGTTGAVLGGVFALSYGITTWAIDQIS